MYSLTIHFGRPDAVAWSFLFKDQKKAQSIFDNVMNAMSKNTELGGIITDDYGQMCYLAGETISGVLLEDTELGQEARILRGLDQAKGQARATQRAKTDPELRALMQNQGPGVLTPFANGGFRPQ